jgi:hypothetical protein
VLPKSTYRLQSFTIETCKHKNDDVLIKSLFINRFLRTGQDFLSSRVFTQSKIILCFNRVKFEIRAR